MKLRCFCFLLAFIFSLTSAVLAGTSLDLSSSANYNLRFDGASAGDFLGNSVATGDINGDGYLDYVIGANAADYSGLQSGSVYIVYGKPSLSGDIDLSSYYDARFDGAVAGDQLGSSVACGDVNGDGKADIVFGSYLANGGSGTVYLILGSSSLSGIKDLSNDVNFDARFDGVAGSYLGYSLGLGDVNNDGFADLVLGAPQAGSGEVYLIFGKSSFATKVSTLSAAANYDAKFIGAVDGERFGSAVALGDINNDGLADILIGAYLASNNGRTNSGSVYCVVGATSYSPKEKSMADATNYLARFDGAENGDELGNPGEELGRAKSLAVSDISGDGKNEIIMAAHKAQSGAGSVYVISGTTSISGNIDLNSSANYDLRLDGSESGERLGTSVVVGKVNNDTVGDLVLGAAYADKNSRADSGSVYIIYGTSEIFAVKQRPLSNSDYYDLRLDGAATGDKLGYALAPNAVLGAFSAGNNGRTFSGSVYIYSIYPQPKISSVSPSMVMQGWIGDLIISGEGFQNGAVVSFEGTGIGIFKTVYVSSLELKVRINVSPTTAASARSLVVTNPDGQAGFGYAKLNVSASGIGPTFTDIVFSYNGSQYRYPADIGSDGKLPLPAHTGLSISGKIEDTSGLPSTAEAVKFSIYSQGSNYLLYYNLAEKLSNLTSTSVDFSFTNLNIVPGTDTIVLYAEDADGNPTQYSIPFKVVEKPPIEKIYYGETADSWIIQTYANEDMTVDLVITGLNPHPLIIKNVRLYSPQTMRAMGITGNAALRGYTQTVVSKAGLPLGVYALAVRKSDTGEMIKKNGKVVFTKLINRGTY